MKKCLIAFTILLTAPSACAQVNPELNKLILQSFGYFPRLKELTKSAELSELRIDIAQTNYLPTINGVASYNYVDPVSQTTFPISPTESRLLKFQPNNNYNTGLTLNQLLWDFGKGKAQIDKTKAELLTSRQNIEAAKLQVAAQVVSIYYSLIYLQKASQLQDSVIAAYEKNKQIIEGRIRQGDGLSVDLANIQNSLDQEKIRQTEFKRQHERQAALLNYTTGQPYAVTNVNFDFQTTTSGAPDFSANPDLLSSMQRIEGAKAEGRLAASNRFPTLSLQAGLGFRNGFQPNIDEFRFNYLGGVTLNIPVFQGSRLNLTSSLARKSEELSELSKINTETTLQKDWQSAKIDYEAYEKQIQSAESQIKAAQEAKRLTEVRFNRGVATYLDLVFALTNLQRSLLNQLQYQYQATLAKAELAKLKGIKFWQE